ncbi:hypothetical protein P152DRAFT_480916 [Eremomyces bilateralis CBS 781.70]|uniref:Uncharacterized protein n=1 Tax=Eremomyces bilateralis CBS 781.70 TaxID=1392243 RepID=A0A6G1G6J4_9PEZI|nr:uncharacterized protein P152DRAFT_480916 [Eremomyces bilateralis CBS 781.70]KAF1813687.1 hypothetical protein P152DRAFT_480916 [Eremomyces bilateralis CBS 781.70]
MLKSHNMAQNRHHTLLQQLPLTVSPFLNLPTATTLSYTYKTLPSTLPPSILDSPSASPTDQPQPQPKYVISHATGHAAHPSSILASCEALVSHLDAQRREAEEAVRGWEQGIRERELAEKRRVAPGWLDAEERLLVPERSGAGEQEGGGAVHGVEVVDRREGEGREGEELDRAFGGMKVG